MQVSVRSSLTAGVALVGAGAIALSPIAPLPADVVVKAGHAGTVYADYTPTALATAIVDTNAVSVPTPSDLATALGLLVLGGSQALNTGINGVGTGINQGLTALQNITSTTNTTLQGINNQLTTSFLAALGVLFPPPENASTFRSLAAPSAAAALALPGPTDLATALGPLVLGGSQAFNTAVNGIATGINQGLTGLQNITSTTNTTLQGINNQLTAAFLAALGVLFPPQAAAASTFSALAAPSVASALPGPSDLATAFGLLVLGASQALNTGINGVATGINQGLTGLQNITSTTNTTLQGINNQLTTAFLAALGVLVPAAAPSTLRALAAPSVASALPGPSDFATALGLLVLGGSQAFNTGVNGVATGINQGLTALQNITSTTNTTLQGINNQLTAGFLGALGTLFPPPSTTVMARTLTGPSSLALPGPSDFATALGLLTLGGSQALNTGINGVATGINQGLTGLQNITSTTNTTLQGINNQLTAGFLGALEALHPATPAPTAELKSPPLRALSAKALPAATDTSVGGGESVTVSVSTAPKAIEAATTDIKAQVKAKMGATSKVRVVEAPKADTSKADDNGKSADSTKSGSTKSDSDKASSTKADNPVKKLRDQVKKAMGASKKDSAKTSGGDSGGSGVKAGASSGGGGADK